jgi:transposase-like protein
MAHRKKYSEEFKREAVALTRQPGANVSHIARDIGVSANQVFRWRREMKSAGDKAFPGNGVARDQELLALKMELARVKKERDFCAMRRRSSPRNRLEVRVDPTPPRPVPDSVDVPVPEGLA